MRKHKYKIRDKTVNKMSREGLMEENLRNKDSHRVSQRELDRLSLPSQAEEIIISPRAYPHGNEQWDRSLIEAGTPKRRAGKQLYEAYLRNELMKPSISFRKEIQMHVGQSLIDDAELETETSCKLPEQSSYMMDIRGHPSRTQGYLEEKGHSQKKKLVQAHFRMESTKPADCGDRTEKISPFPKRGQETSGGIEEISCSFRKNAKQNQKWKQTYPEQEKQPFRLSFDDEKSGMIHGAGMGISKKAAETTSYSAMTYVHGKIHDVEEDNSAVEGVHWTENIAEHSLRQTPHYSRRSSRREYSRWRETTIEEETENRLKFDMMEEPAKPAEKRAAEAKQAEKTKEMRFWQKQRNKKSYQAAKRSGQSTVNAEKATRTFSEKAKNTVSSILRKHKGIICGAAVLGLLFLMLSTLFSSCNAIVGGASSSIIGSTYPSTDEDIYYTENAYVALESALNSQINNIESIHPGYDEYRYQVDEISHNPYYLISYFTAKYGEFTYEQVADELEEIFQEQYSLYVSETSEMVTETKTVRVGESLGQVTTSGYCNCSICCGRWSGGPTASGVYPAANHTLAVDASTPFVPIGTKVIMNGVEYVVEDTGNFARYGVQFDIYYNSHSAASSHGLQTCEAFISDENGMQGVEVTTTEVVKRLEIKLTNHGLDAVLRNRMDVNEEKRYDLYNTTYGNRDYLFDVETLPSGDMGSYEIPPEALSDEKFARMVQEAEKYLGTPYVWGGDSPSTGFDCSGFVSWVINHCGNGWSVGRQTAEGLRSCCSRVSPADVKPGDLIFFQGTYNTSGASHVGIYVGNNMMIHCGNPIQYANINTLYWQQHFLSFGRLP